MTRDGKVVVVVRKLLPLTDCEKAPTAGGNKEEAVQRRNVFPDFERLSV
jgi:hypothetical protein